MNRPALSTGGRRGIRTLDALNGHAAFPGRYIKPLCHPSVTGPRLTKEVQVLSLPSFRAFARREKADYKQTARVLSREFDQFDWPRH